MSIRLTESRLRKIIREELGRLDEMPFGGSLGAIVGPAHPDERNHDRARRDSASVVKYTQSGLWMKQAEAYYINVPITIWVATFAGWPDRVFGDLGIRFGEHRRADVVPMRVGKQALLGAGYEPHLVNGVGDDDLILCVSGGELIPGGLPSAWIVMHSIFDSQEERSVMNLVPSFRKVRKLCHVVNDIPGALTMKSARTDTLGGPDDAAAEMVVQQLITRSRFRPNVDAVISNSRRVGTPEQKLAELEELRDAVKQTADEFGKNARGKVIFVQI